MDAGAGVAPADGGAPGHAVATGLVQVRPSKAVDAAAVVLATALGGRAPLACGLVAGLPVLLLPAPDADAIEGRAILAVPSDGHRHEADGPAVVLGLAATVLAPGIEVEGPIDVGRARPLAVGLALGPGPRLAGVPLLQGVPVQTGVGVDVGRQEAAGAHPVGPSPAVAVPAGVVPVVLDDGEGRVRPLVPGAWPRLGLARHEETGRALEVLHATVPQVVVVETGHALATTLLRANPATNEVDDDAQTVGLAVPLRQETTGAVGPFHGRHAVVAAAPALLGARHAGVDARVVVAHGLDTAPGRVHTGLRPDRPAGHAVARLGLGHIRTVHDDAPSTLPGLAVATRGVETVAVTSEEGAVAEGLAVVHAVPVPARATLAGPVADTPPPAEGVHAVATAGTATLAANRRRVEGPLLVLRGVDGVEAPMVEVGLVVEVAPHAVHVATRRATGTAEMGETWATFGVDATPRLAGRPKGLETTVRRDGDPRPAVEVVGLVVGAPRPGVAPPRVPLGPRPLPADEASPTCGGLALAQAVPLRRPTVPRGAFPSYAVEVVGAEADTPVQVAGLGARRLPALEGVDGTA